MTPEKVEGRPPGNGGGPQIRNGIGALNSCPRYIGNRPAPQAFPRRIDEARLRRLARSTHALGERPLFELFKELERGADLRDELEQYAALAPLADFITQQRGDRLPVAFLVVGGVQ
jgi:hypothetical protein